MERTLIKDISKFQKKEVLLKGRIINIRRLGNITFLIFEDYTGTIQVVFEKKVDARVGDIVEVKGEVKKEPRAKGGYEILGVKVDAISEVVEDFPFDLTKNDLNLNLTTLLDKRPLSLRHRNIQAIFKLYNILLSSYETVMREENFVEIKTPKILGSATEGGTNFFCVDYFEKKGTLAQSPQFYKQIMVGVFERVFEIGSVFRAEPHFTTRHMSEYVSLDAEFGFINDFYDVSKQLNVVIKKMFQIIKEEGKEYLELYNIELPDVSDEIPHIRLSDVRKIVKKEYDYDIPEDTDIDPQGERLAGRYAKEKYNSDFVFITHYPFEDRPFYTMPDSEKEGDTCGFDLLYKGLEISTGGQRIHNYQQLTENMKKKGVKKDGMEFYLDVFKYGMPPHGGWGMGSERIIQQMLGLKSIKEATLFPRDVKRISP